MLMSQCPDTQGLQSYCQFSGSGRAVQRFMCILDQQADIDIMFAIPGERAWVERVSSGRAMTQCQ